MSFWNCRKKLISDTQNDTNKLVDKKAFIDKHKPHVLGVIESDLHSVTSNSNRSRKFTTTEVHEKLNIQGYNLVLPDTWEEHGQARIVAYISEEVNYKRRATDPQIKDLPNITMEIGLGKEKKTTINIFYR